MRGIGTSGRARLASNTCVVMTALALMVALVSAVGVVSPTSAQAQPTLVTQGAPAEAPTDLTALNGYQAVMVTFTPGAAVGSTFTNYEYQLDDGAWIPLDPADIKSPVVIPELPNGVPFQLRLRAVTAVGPGLPSEPVAIMGKGAGFRPVNPYRVYDSRTADGPLLGGQSRLVATDVPEGTVAVAYNLTAVGMEGSGYLTVSQGGVTAPGSSTLNYTAPGQQWANAYITGVDAQGQVQVAAVGAPTQFIVDVVGFFMPQFLPVDENDGDVTIDATPAPVGESLFVPVLPTRAYDSRDLGAGGPMTDGRKRRVNVTAAGLVPPKATAVAYTLTQTGTVGRGYLAVGLPGHTEPDVSSINWFESNQTSANSSVAAINAGFIDVWAGTTPGGSSHFVIDVLGYYLLDKDAPWASGYTSLAPARAYDSRIDQPAGPIVGGGVPFTTSMAVAGIPAGAGISAVEFNLTATGGTGSGFLTTTPGNVLSPPVASTINWWLPQQTLANGSVVEVPVFPNVQAQRTDGPLVVPQGTLGLPVTTFAGGGSTQYVIDVAGYFSLSTDR